MHTTIFWKGNTHLTPALHILPQLLGHIKHQSERRPPPLCPSDPLSSRAPGPALQFFRDAPNVPEDLRTTLSRDVCPPPGRHYITQKRGKISRFSIVENMGHELKQPNCESINNCCLFQNTLSRDGHLLDLRFCTEKNTNFFGSEKNTGNRTISAISS